MSEPPPKLRTLRPEVPAGLEAVVLRCLEKAPADRYSSVAALAVALTPFASTRTLGLQARLRTSVSRPAPAVPAAPIQLIQATQIVVDAPLVALHDAVAPTAPAPAPAPSSLLAAPAAPREHAKTNTAWAEQSASAASRSTGVRRRWLIAGGGLGAVVLGAALLLARPGAAPNVSPAASPPPAALAAPLSTEPPPRPADSAVTQAPKVVPVVEPATAPGAAEPVRAAQPGATAVEPGGPATAPDGHTTAPAPTAAPREPVAPPATVARSTRRAQAKPSAEAGARTRASATSPAKATTSAHAASTPRPAAQKPAPAKSKPLSIEFK